MTEPHKAISLLLWCCIFVMGLSWSGITDAGVGDTYFCDMEEWSAVKGGEVGRYPPQRFMFQWKPDQIVFGKGGYFDDFTIPLVVRVSTQESFYARGAWSLAYFTDGRFRYVTFSACSMPCDGEDEVLFIVADCSSFSE